MENVGVGGGGSRVIVGAVVGSKSEELDGSTAGEGGSTNVGGAGGGEGGSTKLLVGVGTGGAGGSGSGGGSGAGGLYQAPAVLVTAITAEL